jgi:hypothetical protein
MRQRKFILNRKTNIKFYASKRHNFHPGVRLIFISYRSRAPKNPQFYNVLKVPSAQEDVKSGID